MITLNICKHLHISCVLECNCNDHAEECKFDERVFQANKDRGISDSGGVCQDCTGNTEGYQCDSCKTFFYQDPELALNHPEICKPCDCEPDGTTDGGECDRSTDEENGEVAGRCHCKTYTGGKRCDHCKNGYWNFTTENPDGCQGMLERYLVGGTIITTVLITRDIA